MPIQNASDIHIETGKTGATIRFRLDGVLVPMQTVQASVGRALAARLKVLAHLNVLEQRRPQDGRIELRTAHLTLDVRISIVPAALGESVVLRILQDTMLPPFVFLWLEIAQKQGDGASIFSFLAEYYRKKDIKKREITMKFIEPAAIAIVGVYVLLLIQSLVIPLLTYYGNMF